MSEPNVLVNFRLDRDKPMRVKWLATDGAPGDGYKPQITSVRLPDGATLRMDGSAIMEQCAPADDEGEYIVTFTGVVGFAAVHPDRAHIDAVVEDEIDYEIEFHAEDGRVAVEGVDYTIVDRPRGMARNFSKRAPSAGG